MSLTERVLDLVAQHAPGAEAEVTSRTQTLALTRFADSFIHQNVADTTTTVQLRLHVDGRTASGTTTVAGPPEKSLRDPAASSDPGGSADDVLIRLVERTLAASRLLPADPGWPGLTPATEPVGTGNYDEATANADPAARAKVVRGFVDAAGGLTTAGYCRTTGGHASFGNTAGQHITAAVSSVAVDAIARTGTSDGVARSAGMSLADVDGAALGAVAAAKARAGADPVDLPPDHYEVVLEPSAVTDLLLNLCLWGYNGKALGEGRSFVELGARQLDSAVTLVDDPTGPHALGVPFDAEGTPGRPLHLVRNGVSVAVAHDRRTAKEVGATSTGHAMPPGFTAGPFPTSALLRPGTAATAPGNGRPVVDEATAGLLAGVHRGLLVTDLWYTRVLDPRTLAVTGLTRNGVWLVEDGEIVRPVSNLRFTQSYPEALAPGRVRAVGAAVTTIPYHWGLLSLTAPPLHLASWHFTGGAAG